MDARTVIDPTLSMKIFLHLLPVLLALSLAPGPAAAAETNVRVPEGIETSGWQALLERYVDDRGLVDYGRWQANAADLRRLDEFIAAYARAEGPAAEGAERVAALINAYNAMTIRWIISNYPTESIRELDDSWTAARWDIGGRRVSLDDIEHRNLRPIIGWRVHAIVVCAARSCPPLLRTAFTAGNLETLTDQAFETWLAREDLNQFDPAAGVVRLSEIFKWYRGDFTGEGELGRVLERYAPARHREFLARRAYRIEYLDYHWGLNDQGGRGRDYRLGLLRRLF
jgi:hypothetical protein